jgi:hypothetical protein
MEEKKTNRHIGRKIWYGTAITLSVLVLLISTVGVIGAWIVEQSLVGVTQGLLIATARTAGGLREVAAQINQESGDLRQISEAVSVLSLKIGANIEDKGLAATLLPAEQEQKINDTVLKIQETLSTVREFLTSAIGIYRSLDRLPFVNLPGLSEEKVVELVQVVSDIQASVAELRQNVQDFRTGVAEGVSRITQAADRVTQGLDKLSAMLVELDKALAALQALATRLEKIVPLAFALAASFLTIFMAYVAYTQVEFIRVEVRRWKALNTPALALVAGGPAAEAAFAGGTAAKAATTGAAEEAAAAELEPTEAEEL